MSVTIFLGKTFQQHGQLQCEKKKFAQEFNENKKKTLTN